MDLPDKKIIKKIGFQRDQDGIMNRYYREGERWNEHLEKTRAFIKDSFKDRSIRSIGIMGSGWLLDVPLEGLLSRFQTVVLLDIRHPVEVRHRVRKMKNVILQEVDLTGGAVDHCHEVKRKLKRNEAVHLTEGMFLRIPSRLKITDAFVSLNLLNQLNGILLDYLEADKYFQQSDIDEFNKRIQDFHINWITSKPGCIITDVREIYISRSGDETSKSLLHTKLPEGKRKENWIWNFDTEETYRSGMETRISIHAIEW